MKTKVTKNQYSLKVVVNWVVNKDPSPLYVQLWDKLLADVRKGKATRNSESKVDHYDHDEEML